MSPTKGAGRLAEGDFSEEVLYLSSPPDHTEEVVAITPATWVEGVATTSPIRVEATPLVGRNIRSASAPPVLTNSSAQEASSSPILPGAGRGLPQTRRAEFENILNQAIEGQQNAALQILQVFDTNEGLKAANEELQQRLEEKAAENDRKEQQHEKEIAEHRDALQKSEENLRTEKEENETVRKEKDELNQRLSNRSEYVSVLELEKADLERERQVQELKKKNDKLKMVAGVAFKERKEVWSTKNQLEANLATSASKLNRLTFALADKERELEQAQESLFRAQQELEEYYPLKNSLEEHQRKVEQLQGELFQTREVHKAECSNLQQTLRQREKLLTQTLGAFQLEEVQTLGSEGFSSSDESSYTDLLELVSECPQLSELVRRLAQNKRANKKENFSITFSSDEDREVHGNITGMDILAGAAAMVSSQEWEPDSNDTYPGEPYDDYPEPASFDEQSQPMDTVDPAEETGQHRSRSPSTRAEPRPRTRTWESLYESVYRSIDQSDQQLKSRIENELQQKKDYQGLKGMKLFNALAEELNKNNVVLPDWPEVHEQQSWSGELVQYAIFRLKVDSCIHAPCSFLGLLKVDTNAYFLHCYLLLMRS